jgi:hypothetical protein
MSSSIPCPSPEVLFIHIISPLLSPQLLKTLETKGRKGKVRRNIVAKPKVRKCKTTKLNFYYSGLLLVTKRVFASQTSAIF